MTAQGRAREPIERHQVLDQHGYLHLWGTFGDDLEVVNDARVSHEKVSAEMTRADARLIDFLGRGPILHESPFRSQVLKFEVRAPLMVARQWWRYKVASQHVEEPEGWNESSRRYVTDPPDFYVPEVWRAAPASKKQGSGGSISPERSAFYSRLLREHQERGAALYAFVMGEPPIPFAHDYAPELEGGQAAPAIEPACAEQARLFLAAYGLHVRFRWTCSLQALAHFVTQRWEHDSQWEIREYAQVCNAIGERHFPLAWEQLMRDPVAEMRARALHLLAQHGLWNETDGTYTFPDGDTWERPQG